MLTMLPVSWLVGVGVGEAHVHALQEPVERGRISDVGGLLLGGGGTGGEESPGAENVVALVDLLSHGKIAHSMDLTTVPFGSTSRTTESTPVARPMVTPVVQPFFKTIRHGSPSSSINCGRRSSSSSMTP
jgi:hypothetical protein